MTDLATQLKNAAPLSKWRMRNGEMFVFGAYNPDASQNDKIVGWFNGGHIRLREDGWSECFSDDWSITGPWPLEPVSFEDDVHKTPVLGNAYLVHSELEQFIGKRVRVTVQEVV